MTSQSDDSFDSRIDYRQMGDRPSKPVGVTLFGAMFRFNSKVAKRTFHKTLVLCVTFIAYTCFHMGRRPLSIVKNVLNRNCSSIHNLTNLGTTTISSTSSSLSENPPLDYLDYSQFLYDQQATSNLDVNNNSNSNWCDWPPFDNNATANQLLAILDSSFLFAYAICMFLSGYLADRCNLRYFLSAGMILSGIMLYAFGFAYYLDLHSMSYFVIIQVLSGAIQTSGWPAVVTCVGNWFEPSSRGSIFGVWNAHTNLGNILGATVAGYFVEAHWGLSFIVPGFIMLGGGILVFLFLVPRPEDVGLVATKTAPNPDHKRHMEDIEGVGSRTLISDSDQSGASRRKSARPPSTSASHNHNSNNEPDLLETDDNAPLINSSEQSPLIGPTGDSISDTVIDECSIGSRASSHHEHGHIHHQRAASFWECLRLPGVIEYSLCLGFAKLVSYTFLYWLPRYITQSTGNNSEQSAYLSVPFDIGGALGAIVAGYLSDRSKKSALTCVVMLLLAIPAMLIYEKFASISNLHNIGLQLVAGALVNGPYALITTAVSTDLGSRLKDGHAMATVAAIIDGTGSVGAAIGPLFAGFVSDSGWEAVFLMLMLSDLVASLCLARLTLKELGIRR